MALYQKYFSIHIKSEMQFKLSFFLVTAGQFLTAFSTFLGIYFMFLRFNTIAEFKYEEVLLCFATMTMAFSLAELFGSGLLNLPRMLGNGEFDRILVRPCSPVFQVVASKVDSSRLGLFVQAIIVLCYTIPISGVVWTWDKIVTLVLMITCGFLVFMSLCLVQASFSFFTIEGLEFMNILTYGGKEFGRYPYSIYGKDILKFLTFVIPLALFQYYPLLYLLGIEQSKLYMLSPLISLLFIAPCYMFFRFGLRHFKSTGS